MELSQAAGHPEGFKGKGKGKGKSRTSDSQIESNLTSVECIKEDIPAEPMQDDDIQETVDTDQLSSSHLSTAGASIRSSVIFCSKTKTSITGDQIEPTFSESKQSNEFTIKSVDVAKKALFFNEGELNTSNASSYSSCDKINEWMEQENMEVLTFEEIDRNISEMDLNDDKEMCTKMEPSEMKEKSNGNLTLDFLDKYCSEHSDKIVDYACLPTTDPNEISIEGKVFLNDENCLEPYERYSRKRTLDKANCIEDPLMKKLCSEFESLSEVEDSRPSELCAVVSAPVANPPELNQWLDIYNSWSSSERNIALDSLISRSTVLQVRHMMKTIEPLFQTDFISLLPKELALIVLAYLAPEDLSKVAQTCRYWRFLANDNLLWKKLCHRAGINAVRPMTYSFFRPTSTSRWKSTYMNQHIIESNWRTKPATEAVVMRGHDDHVITCLQCHGNRILSGSDDTTLKVWSTITGECLQTLVGHSGGVWSCQMVDNLVVSGSTDRTLRVWDAVTGDCLNVLGGHTSTVRCMRLHKDKVVSGSRDATLRVWSIPRGRCLQVLVGHMAAVRCVQYDGNLVVSGAYDFFVKIWNPDTGECLHTLSGHTNRVYSLKFDSIHVVSGSLDTSIRVWDAKTGQLKHTLIGHTSLITSMELQSNILISGNADSTLKVWDITTGQCLHTLAGADKHMLSVTYVQLLKRFVVSSSDDGTVKLWDLKTGEFIRNIVRLASGRAGGNVLRIRASNTQLVCAVGSRNGTEETKLMLMNFDHMKDVCKMCSEYYDTSSLRRLTES